jgi:hypothetical protein
MEDRRSILRVLVPLAVLVVATFAPHVSLASATVTSSALTCESFSASGTSTSPYATIYAHNGSTDVDYWTIVPVVGGAFSGTVTFPLASPGTTFNLEVWGTLAPYTDFSDPDYWDNESYFSEDRSSCTVTRIPALDRTGLALLATLLGAAGLFAVRRGVA